MEDLIKNLKIRSKLDASAGSKTTVVELRDLDALLSIIDASCVPSVVLPDEKTLAYQMRQLEYPHLSMTVPEFEACDDYGFFLRMAKTAHSLFASRVAVAPDHDALREQWGRVDLEIGGKSVHVMAFDDGVNVAKNVALRRACPDCNGTLVYEDAHSSFPCQNSCHDFPQPD